MPLRNVESVGKMFEQIVRLADEGVWTLDDGNLVDFVNERGAAILGYAPEEMLGRPAADFVFPDEKAEGEKPDERRRGRSERTEYRMRRRDGSAVWVSSSSVPLLGDDGSYQGALAMFSDITERRLMEDALRGSEARFRSVFENSDDAILLTRPDGAILAANPASERMFGMTEHELIGAGRAGIVVPDEHLERALRERAAAGRVRAEVAFRRRGGPTFVGEVVSSVFADADGSKKTSMIIRDISDRKRAEEALRESEERYRGLFGSINDAIYIHDFQGRFLEANEVAYKHLGYSKGELFRIGLARIVAPEFSALISQRMAEIQEKGQLVFESVNLTKDGRRIPVEISTRMISYQGAPALISVSRDISDRKRAEEALRESEARYRQLFENMREGVSLRRMVYDERGEIVDVVLIDANPAVLQAYGANSIEELRDKRYGDMATPNMVAAALGMLKRMKATGESITAEQFSEVNGRYYLVTTTPLGSDQFITMSVDITDRKRAEEELKRSNEELQQFAYVASHDLQEPLRMVTSYLQLLERRNAGKLDEKSKEHLAFAVDGASRMRRMIEDLLAYSRVESKGREFTAVDMDEVLAMVKKDLEVSIEGSGAMVTHDALPTVTADKGQMVQLLENLVSNAIKFRGVAAPQIHISSRGGGREWLFSVSDNGIGIDPRYKDRLFKMFSRLHTREEYEGTGMGLAIARRIVEMHGGRIWFDSKPGKGTTFYFTIPVSNPA